MAYRFEQNEAARSYQSRRELADEKQSAQRDARFWRMIAIVAAAIGIVGILTACAPQPEGYMSAVVEYEE